MELTQDYLQRLDAVQPKNLPPELDLKLAQFLENAHVGNAVAIYQRLAEAQRSRPEGEFALLRLAVLYHQSLNRSHDAARCLRQFLELYPASQWTAQARQLLAVVDQQHHFGRPEPFGPPPWG